MRARVLTRPACASRPAQTAVTWPPPPAPPWAQEEAAYALAWAQAGAAAAGYGDTGACDEYEGEYEADDADGESYDGAAFAAGEVVWRVGDALDDEEGDDDGDDAPEVELELTEEWAARFAQTEHRRAQRAYSRQQASFVNPPCTAVLPSWQGSAACACSDACCRRCAAQASCSSARRAAKARRPTRSRAAPDRLLQMRWRGRR